PPPPPESFSLLRDVRIERSQVVTEIDNAGKTETKSRMHHPKLKSLRCKIAIPSTPLVILNELDKMFFVHYTKSTIANSQSDIHN
ncbi:MAG: hypothetical protein NTX75_00415, partial [Proteobacteria bacterium]|nr:hypothetical protein [Pseudomonadota bacterium]